VRPHLLSFVAAAVVAATLGGCGGAAPGQEAARNACAAYATTGRTQTATTVEQVDAIRATVRADARRAADAATRWRALQRDIDDAFAREAALSQARTADLLNGYFAADRRVQADCAAAGEDIGPLRP
jgi:hypothetical protein